MSILRNSNQVSNTPIMGSATTTTMREAVKSAYEAAKKEETLHPLQPQVVILSPGCASFELFINEFDRGDQFRAEAVSLASPDTVDVRQANSMEIPVAFCTMTDEDVSLIASYFPFQELPETDWGDYLYRKEELLSLSGRKFHGKRNDIDCFKKAHPGYSFTKMTKEDIPAVKDFYLNSGLINGKDSVVFKEEQSKVFEVLDHYDLYGMVGGILRSEGSIRAFSMTVRDALWQDIRLSPELKRIQETAVFQKLGRIRQLGPVALVYPSAVHTRLEHSLGVYHLANEIVLSLLSRQETDIFTLTGIHAFQCAALLHDIGHFPYAHSLKELPLTHHVPYARVQTFLYF